MVNPPEWEEAFKRRVAPSGQGIPDQAWAEVVRGVERKDRVGIEQVFMHAIKTGYMMGREAQLHEDLGVVARKLASSAKEEN